MAQPDASLVLAAEASSLLLPDSPLPQQASPGSPDVAEVMAELAALKKELEQTSAENLMPRKALITPKDDADETEKPEAEDASGALAMPESFVMIPKKPPEFV